MALFSFFSAPVAPLQHGKYAPLALSSVKCSFSFRNTGVEYLTSLALAIDILGKHGKWLMKNTPCAVSSYAHNLILGPPDGRTTLHYTTGNARMLHSSSIKYANAPSEPRCSIPSICSPGLSQQYFKAPCFRKYGLTISCRRDWTIDVGFSVIGLPNWTTVWLGRVVAAKI